MRVLVVEDDHALSSILKDALEKQLYNVTQAWQGKEGFALGLEFEFEFIILDAMLPGMDGYSVARQWHRQGITSKVLMLTARDSTADVVRGLDSGVDDYLTKPFSFEELFARLRALARRHAASPQLMYQVADLSMNPKTHVAMRAGQPVALTRTEHRLLEYMMRNPETVLRREAIINAVWGYETTVENNTLDAFMKQLRNKVDGRHQAKLIQTVRGFGYKLTAAAL